MQYKLYSNLQRWRASRTAISFWEKKEIKDRVSKFLETCSKFKTCEVRNKWREFSKAIVDEWNKDLLIQDTEVELVHIVKMVGETIFNWYQYIKHEYKATEETMSFIDKMYWTPYGTVDVVKVFESSWLENPHLDITKVYNFACSLAFEEHINDLWHKIPEDIRDKCDVDCFVHFDKHIQAYWKCCRDNDLPNLLRYFEKAASNFKRQDRKVYNLVYDLNRSTEVNMLSLSVSQGYFIATKYFWEKLDDEERDESVVKCARFAVRLYNKYADQDDSIGDYKKSQYVEICIFLMNQMTKSHKEAFFNGELIFIGPRPYYIDKLDAKDDILRMLLSTWPWQELFISVLKDMLQYQNDNSRMACRFLDVITVNMVENHGLGYSLETCKYRSLLREVWLIIPGSIKQKIVPDDLGRDFIRNLICVWDLDSLKLIFNDPAIADVRDQFIDLGLESYNEFIIDNQFEVLDQFIEEIFTSEDEKKSFKKKINPWCDILKDHKFDLADKLLDWQSSTPEERQSLKDNIDHMRICETFIEMYDFDLIDEFLNWKFKLIGERIMCQNHFKSDIFVIRQVYDIWRWFRRNLDDAQQKSSKFLVWVLESDEEIERFKEEKLVNLEIDQLTLHNLVMLNSDGIIDDFLAWCLLDDEEIQQIKQAVSQPNLRL